MAETVLTAEQAIERLNALDHDDTEGMHVAADDILLGALRGAGLSAVADAFLAADARCHGFWYS